MDGENLQPSSPQSNFQSKTNPWMVSTLVLVGLVVGFGAGRLPLFGDSGKSGQTSTVPTENAAPPAAPQPSDEDYDKLGKALVSDDDPSYGDPKAPVTVIEFSDFQCPFCAASAGIKNVVYDKLSQDPEWEPIVPKLLATYVKEGKVRFIYRDFPLDGHPQAQDAAEAAQCAHEQGKFLEMHDKIFGATEQWSGDDEKAKQVFKDLAKSLGLKSAQFNDCVDSGKYKEEVRADYQAGVQAGVNGTPAFYVNGRELSGAQAFKTMAKLIDSLL